MTGDYRITPKTIKSEDFRYRNTLVSRFRIKSFKYARKVRKEISGKFLYRLRCSKFFDKLRYPRFSIRVPFSRHISNLPFYRQHRLVRRPSFFIKSRPRAFSKTRRAASISLLRKTSCDVSYCPFIVSSFWTSCQIVHTVIPSVSVLNFRTRLFHNLAFKNFSFSVGSLAVKRMASFLEYKSKALNRELCPDIFRIRRIWNVFWGTTGFFRLWYILTSKFWRTFKVPRLLLFPQNFYKLLSLQGSSYRFRLCKSKCLSFQKEYYRRRLLHFRLLGLKLNQSILSKFSNTSKLRVFSLQYSRLRGVVADKRLYKQGIGVSYSAVRLRTSPAVPSFLETYSLRRRKSYSLFDEYFKYVTGKLSLGFMRRSGRGLLKLRNSLRKYFRHSLRRPRVFVHPRMVKVDLMWKEKKERRKKFKFLYNDRQNYKQKKVYLSRKSKSNRFSKGFKASTKRY